MTDKQLKDRLALIIFLSKFLLLGYILFHWISGGFSTDQMISLITIVLPLFTLHLTIIVKDYLTDNKASRLRGNKLKRMSVLLSITFPLLYFFFMILVISLKPLGSINFEQQKMLVGIGETLFGVNVGIIITEMFKKKEE